MPGTVVSGDNLGRTQEQYDAYWKHWNDVAAQNSFNDAYFNRYAPGGLTAVQKDIVQNQLSKIDPNKNYTRDSNGQLIPGTKTDLTGQEQINFLLNMYGLAKDAKGDYVSKTYAGPASFGSDPVPLQKFKTLWEQKTGTPVPNTYAPPVATTPAAPKPTQQVPAVTAPKTTGATQYYKPPTADKSLATAQASPQPTQTPSPTASAQSPAGGTAVRKLRTNRYFF